MQVTLESPQSKLKLNLSRYIWYITETLWLYQWESENSTTHIVITVYVAIPHISTRCGTAWVLPVVVAVSLSACQHKYNIISALVCMV